MTAIDRAGLALATYSVNYVTLASMLTERSARCWA